MAPVIRLDRDIFPVTRAWRQYVFSQDGTVARKAYTLLPGSPSFSSAPARSLRSSGRHQVCLRPHRAAERRRLGRSAFHHVMKKRKAGQARERP